MRLTFISLILELFFLQMQTQTAELEVITAQESLVSVQNKGIKVAKQRHRGLGPRPVGPEAPAH